MNYPKKKANKKIAFTIALKKYLGRNLTKDIKDQYSKNYKTLKTKNEEDKNKRKHIPYLWIGTTNIIKISILCKAICRINAIPIKTAMVYFTELEEIFQKFRSMWNHKRP